MRRVRFPTLALPLLAATLLSACSETPTASTAVSESAEPAVTAPKAADLDLDALRERAAKNFALNQLFRPEGDNAIEDYLTLRERLPSEQAEIDSALAELAPYIVIASEQAVDAGDFDEADRLIRLLARMDPEAPALPRLGEALVLAQDEAAQTLATEEARQSALVDATPIASSAPPASESTQPLATAEPVPAPSALTATPPAAARPNAPLPPPSPAASVVTGADVVGPPTSASPVAPPSSPAPLPVSSGSRSLLRSVPPQFPESAARRRLSGEVELRLLVAPDGSVERVDVERSSPPGVFDREAVRAARRWRYAEGEVATTVRIVLTFRQP